MLFKESVSSGPQIDRPDLIAIDPERNVGYVTSNLKIYEVNLLTGERQVFYNCGFNLSDMEFDRANNQLLLAVPSEQAIIAIDIATKGLSIISDNSSGSTPQYDYPALLAFSEQTGKLYVADSNLNAIFEVNLNNSARSIISSTNTGSGFDFKR